MIVQSTERVVAGGQIQNAVASCPIGRKVVGGGGLVDPTTAYGLHLVASFPSGDTQWVVVGRSENNALSGTVRAWAVCGYV